ncbi:holin [Kitasatospora sp. NPDC087314]|uniref:holin n=1 Tax=Kitasatospora sp. NPDC087314 TaxID=3364068 RepID=UPI0038022631
MTTGPIETKVKAATLATYLGSTALLEVLTTVQDQPSLLGMLPGWLAPWLLALLPTAVTGVAAYQARHTPRADVNAARAADVPQIRGGQ